MILSTSVSFFYSEPNWLLTLSSFYCLIRATQLSKAQLPDISAQVNTSNDTLSVRMSDLEIQFEQLSATVPTLPCNGSLSPCVEEMVLDAELQNPAQEVSTRGLRQRSGISI